MKISMIYIVAVVAARITSCDNSFDSLSSINSAPEISFMAGALVTEFADSVKAGIKVSSIEYVGTVYVGDKENGVNAVKFSYENRLGSFFIDGAEVEQGALYTTGNVDQIQFVVAPGDGLGSYKINATIVDNIGAESNATLNLLAFDNLVPVGMLSVSKLGIINNLHYSFDASESFDTDASRGGEVVRYQFMVNEVDLEIVDNPIVEFVFPRFGGYDVSVKVQDNNGVWSKSVSKVVSVN